MPGAYGIYEKQGSIYPIGDATLGGGQSRTFVRDPRTGQLVLTSSTRPGLIPATYGSGGTVGGGVNPLQAYLDSVAKAEAEARAANESRYAEGKQGYYDRWQRNMNELNNLSSQGEADLRSAGAKGQAQAHQDLVSRGFGGSAALPSIKAGIGRQTQEAVNRWKDSRVQQKIDTDSRLSGDYLGFIERRTDSYPDLGQMMGLAQAYGYGNGGGYTSYSTSGGSGGGGGYGSGGAYRGTRYPTTGGRVRGGGGLAQMPWQPGPRAALTPALYRS